jgi:hypothetical protein
VGVLIKQHRRTAAAAVAVAVTGLAAACSGGTAPPAPSSTAAPGATTPQAAGRPATAQVPAASAPRSTAPPGNQAGGTLANGTTWVAQYPQSWNGTLILYSHGYGDLSAVDAPDSQTESALLSRGYALAGSSYDPGGSEWALNTAVGDQFGTLAAVENQVLPRKPAHVIAYGQSMGGLVSALEAQRGAGKINGALTACGVVAGGVNLNEYQLDGEYAIAQLLGDPSTPLTGLDGDSAQQVAGALTGDANQAQGTSAGQARLALAMAFLNLPAWHAAAGPADREAAQYDALTSGSDNAIAFSLAGRVSIEQAAGGQPATDAGTNYAQVLAGSPDKTEVTALYRAAGLNLDADLATLTKHAAVKGDPAAARSLQSTSVPTGKLAVPELDLHTTGDNLVPVQQENTYAALVAKAGSSGLLRQAYTDSQGHCNFSVSEQVAGLQAVLTRITSGQWQADSTTAGLQQSAQTLNIDAAHFTSYSPGKLTGATEAG